MAKLAALVPAPRAHLRTFHGILAPAARWRPLIVPTPDCDFQHNVVKAATLWFNGLWSIYGLKSGTCAAETEIDYTNRPNRSAERRPNGSCKSTGRLGELSGAFQPGSPGRSRPASARVLPAPKLAEFRGTARAAILCLISALSATLCLIVVRLPKTGRIANK
jgi:hypothetical protein